MEVTLENIEALWLVFEAEANAKRPGGFGQNCTISAMWVKDKHFPDGVVTGYHHDNNPTAVIGEAEGGHDFLIVGDYIIDFWYRYWYGDDKPVLVKLDECSSLYGDRSKFEIVPT